MKKTLKIVLYTTASIILAAVVALLYFTITEWRPLKIESVNYSKKVATPIDKDTIKIVSWNIGYAGLGNNMDFFYDGGKCVRTTEQRTRQNLDSIISFLRSTDADFILLQEVDSISKRNYNINLYKEITTSLSGYAPYYALNYNSQFVPIPIREPIGQVRSGLLTLSKYGALKAERFQYPSSFPYPVRLFNLKRALLSTEYKTKNGSQITIANTHNSAFDDGKMRKEELNFITHWASTIDSFILAGDWNSTPPGYRASKEELSNRYFSPIAVSKRQFGGNILFAVDTTLKSARYNYEPYILGKTTTTLIDFAIYSTNIKSLECKIVDQQFKYSDHNPVIYQFVIE